jgi:hypothetical protein
VWPSAFLDQEVWLRARRLLVSGLQDAGLTAGEEEYQAYVEGQEQLGRSLNAMLRPLLGDEEFNYLCSELMCGADNARFVLRYPFMLAFGHEYARGIRSLSGDGASGDAAPALAALFNFGIALLDHIGEQPARYGAIDSVIDDSALFSVLRARGHSPHAAHRSRAALSPELKILGRVIDAFFTGVSGLAGARDPDAWELFTSHVIAAHSAQRTADEQRLLHQRGGDGMRKSVEPFLVMLAVVNLERPLANTAPMFDLAGHIGRAFWRIDDLADLSQDVRLGHVNSLLAAGDEVSNDESFIATTLGRVLSDDSIDRAAASALHHAAAGLRIMREARGARGEFATLERWLLMYALDWLR